MSVWGSEPEHLECVTVAPGREWALERFGSLDAETPVLVFLHGIGAYGAPYRRFAAQLAARGILVYLPHLPGHGDSPGPRGRIGSRRRLFAELSSVLDHVRAQNPGREIVFGGESMGALIVLGYAAATHPGPERLLLLSPAVRLRWLRIAKAGLARLSAGLKLSGGVPVHGTVPGEEIRDPAFKERCLTDPKMVQTAGPKQLLTLAALMHGWTRKYPRAVRQPTLIVHGEGDRLLNHQASRLLADCLPFGRLLLVPSAWHNLLWDPTAESTADAVADWLAERPAARH